MIVGEPPGFTSAMLFPATSLETLSAKVLASVRQTRAAAVSKPEGAGVSSRRLRNATEEGLSIVARGKGARRSGWEPGDRESNASPAVAAKEARPPAPICIQNVAAHAGHGDIMPLRPGARLDTMHG